MGSHVKGKHPFWKSFVYAMRGIMTTLFTERNFRFHCVAAIVVIGFGFYFPLTGIEWLFILLAVFGMLILELINSSIERVVDLVTKEYHPLAKEAKDIAAAAVFVYAIFSIIVGCIIFLPKILA